MAKKTKDDEKKDATSDGSVAVNDAWTGLLVISFIALMVGAGFLLWDYTQYPAKAPTPPKLTGFPPAEPQPQAPPKGAGKIDPGQAPAPAPPP